MAGSFSSRRLRAGLAGAVILLAACGAPAPPTEARFPNIVLIVPDDLGRHDVSFHGGEIATPNIDRIAAEGVLIERFYTAPICSPTRAGLLTGRYPIRYGLMRDVISPWQDFGLATEEVALPEVLAAAGYEHRAVFGKWHLGHISRKYHPLRRGFTESVGHNTSIDYFTKERYGERDWFHGYEPASEEGYVTDLVAEHAVRFIDRRAPQGRHRAAGPPPSPAFSERSTITTSRRTPSSSSSATTAAAPMSATTGPTGARRAPSSREAHGSLRRRAGLRAVFRAVAG